MISTGRGKPPNTGTTLDWSTMQTKRSAMAAMIFSRVSAPPPPLIIRRPGSISSAPSTYTGMLPTASSGRTSMPSSRSSRVLSSELDTAPLKRFRIWPSSRMKSATVEPLPTPTTAPSTR
jgi:hypothetical protein